MEKTKTVTPNCRDIIGQVEGERLKEGMDEAG